MSTDLHQRALAKALGRDERDAGISGEPMMAAIAHASRVERLEGKVDRMQAALHEIICFPYVGAQASQAIVCIARAALNPPADEQTVQESDQ